MEGARGMATCRALLESSPDLATHLNLEFRRDVRVYYKVCAGRALA